MRQVSFFFFNDTATTEIYTLSLHDALPISVAPARARAHTTPPRWPGWTGAHDAARSEEHTSELQSPCNLVCRLLLEKKKKSYIDTTTHNLRRHTTNNPLHTQLQRLLTRQFT